MNFNNFLRFAGFLLALLVIYPANTNAANFTSSPNGPGPITENDSDVVIFSWSNLEIDGLHPLPTVTARAEGRYSTYFPGSNGHYAYHWAPDPVTIGQEAAQKLSALPEGQRFLFIRGFGQACRPELRNIRDCLAIGGSNSRLVLENLGHVLREEYKTITQESYRRPLTVPSGSEHKDFHEIWLTKVLKTLKDQNIKPDMIVLDYEAGFQYWHIKPKNGNDPDLTEAFYEEIYAVYSDLLPDELLAYDPADFGDYWNSREHPNGKRAVVAWNSFADQKKAEVLGYSVRKSVEKVYGSEDAVSLSNYHDTVLSQEHRDFNNWPKNPENVVMTGDIASPVLYLAVGNRHGRTNLQNGIDYDLSLQDVLGLMHDAVFTMQDPDKIVPWVSLFASEEGYRNGDIPHEIMMAPLNRTIIEEARIAGVKSFILFEHWGVLNSATPEQRSHMLAEIEDLVNWLHNYDDSSSGNLAATDLLPKPYNNMTNIDEQETASQGNETEDSNDHQQSIEESSVPNRSGLSQSHAAREVVVVRAENNTRSKDETCTENTTSTHDAGGKKPRVAVRVFSSDAEENTDCP